MKTHPWEVRQIDAISAEEGGWNYNESWQFDARVEIEDGKEREYLLNRFIKPEYHDKCEVEYDGDVYELCFKEEDMRPVFCLIPVYESEE